MARLLPVINILDTDFQVDLRRMELRELADPSNRISFYDLQDKGDCLLLLYDKANRKAYPDDPPRQPLPDKVQYVKLPPLEKLDPFTYTLLTGRHDTRLELLKKAIQILNRQPGTGSHQYRKI